MVARTPKVIAGPAEEPITVEEARAHLEAPAYEDSDVDPIDDTMIEGWLGAAREMCEQFLGLSLAPQTLEIALDSFPTTVLDGLTWVELPMGPVQEIVEIMAPAVEGFDTDDVDSDAGADEPIYADGQVNPGTYVLDNYIWPARVVPVPLSSAWPAITAATNAIKVRYVAGYGDGGPPMPRAARAAILICLASLYANRGDDPGALGLSRSAAGADQIPASAEALLRPLRVRLGMA